LHYKPVSNHFAQRGWEGGGVYRRGGYRHLQIGRMLDIDLISEPPTPPPPKFMYPKCGNLCGQRGRKRFIASWGLRVSHICPCTPCPSPQGYRSKVESRHFAHHWLYRSGNDVCPGGACQELMHTLTIRDQFLTSMLSIRISFPIF
jgi:hypothetical protein